MTKQARFRTISLATAVFLAAAVSIAISKPGQQPRSSTRSIVGAAIRPAMLKYNIPGMAVGVTDGGRSLVINYGIASTKTGRPVTDDTLFELGSVSKTLTATLASYAQVQGYLSLSDRTSKYLPALRYSKFGDVALLDLGTHTPGGLPLQVPEGIRTDNQLMQYFKKWRPTYAPQTYRTYSNVGIGTLGLITAKSMGGDFTALMEQRLFPALGMKNSYINVPMAKMADYAWGYTRGDAPIRMTTGELWPEAYGVRTTAADMLRFVKANMHSLNLGANLQRAITNTHTGYFNASGMTQDLIWEQYPYPAALKTLLTGNSPAMIFNPTRVSKIVPPQRPREDVWINKTGSTNGFGAYVAFIPAKHLGIVILANKNFPISERVTIAYKILTSLANGAR